MKTLAEGWKQYRLQVLCVAAGLLAGGASWLAGRQGEIPGDGYWLERNARGEGEASYHIFVEGLEEEPVPAEIILEERRCTREEAEQLYEQLMEQLPDVILGENQSLQEIRSDLNLTDSLDGIRLSWESDDPEILDSFGTIQTEELPEEGRLVCLRVGMTDGVWPADFLLEVRVKPPAMTEEQRRYRGLMDFVSKREKEQRTSGGLVLPAEFEGKELTYRYQEDSSFWTLTALGVAAALAMGLRERSQEEQKKKKRREQMLLDYSEVLSRLIIFLGAGFSIRSAWDRIVQDYRRGVEEKGRPVRWVYEEMYVTDSQLKSGVAESKAFSEFGRRCGLQPYRKLGGLLEQNCKNGSRNLRETLRLQMTDAFEQRKHQARRLGEEAGTKLLLPLFLLLAVVMVMISVPALLEFR